MKMTIGGQEIKGVKSFSMPRTIPENKDIIKAKFYTDEENFFEADLLIDKVKVDKGTVFIDGLEIGTVEFSGRIKK